MTAVDVDCPRSCSLKSSIRFNFLFDRDITLDRGELTSEPLVAASSFEILPLDGVGMRWRGAENVVTGLECC